MAKTSLATFAAGCFWGVEERFRCLPGVVKTEVGYTGGSARKPNYGLVCTDLTGHAEAVRVEFDPKKISYGKLLDVFWASHDPTALNRQGFDVGTQYRSAIFFHGKAQEKEARESLAELEESGVMKGRIVTQIAPAAKFWKAEGYHQKYLAKIGKEDCEYGRRLHGREAEAHA